MIRVRKKDIECRDNFIEQKYSDENYKYHTNCPCGKYNYFSSEIYYWDTTYKVKCPNCKKVTKLIVW